MNASTARRELHELKVAIAEKEAEAEKVRALLAEVEAKCTEPPRQDQLSPLLAQKASAGVDWVERRLAGEDAPLPQAVTASLASIADEQRARAEAHKELVEALAPARATLNERLDACSNALRVLRWQQLSVASRFVAGSAALLASEFEASARKTRILAARIISARAWLADRHQADLLQGLPSVESIEATPLPAQVEAQRENEKRAWGEWVARLCADPDADPEQAVSGAVAQTLGALRQSATGAEAAE